MRLATALFLTLVLLLPAGSAVSAAEPTMRDLGDDQVILVQPDAGGGIAPQATDPLGLQPFVDMVRVYSLGTDVIDVWSCKANLSVATVVAQLDATVVPYVASHSRGRLAVDFIARGSASGVTACFDAAEASPSANANGALFVAAGSGGYGGPGYIPPYDDSWPANQRYAVVGYDWVFPMVTMHELGHTYSWPHVDTITNGDVYDNALDVMSGNNGFDGPEYDLPYATAAINRYAAGWMDAAQVRVLTNAAATFRLEPSTGSGTQMAVLWDGDRYFTLGARTRSTYDPIPTQWQGVEINEVTPCPSTDLVECFLSYDGAFSLGFKDVAPYGRVPYHHGDATLHHVIQAGASKTVLGRTISVTTASGGAYDVTISKGATFTDIGGTTFEDDIEWLAAEGITKGCTATKFCPNASVTRGQMAAFLHRALPDLPVGSPIAFTDTNGTTFEADIDWLSASGVTKGCTATKFCPNASVTRGQMAAFLHRALPDLPVGSPIAFTDTNGTTFEADIAWLAATGVTKGCTATKFCPNDPVTRGQMAAFLHRALD